MPVKIILNTPTNIIMGFLGAGKTTAILDLLKQKPVGEKWAVLVNEFGSIGIDGAIYASQGIAVKEVAGGCMCCVAGVSMQVAINALLKEYHPDRLLIEPTGLGHPKKVFDTLKGEGFRDSLCLQASICLLDPNHLKNSQYTEHENFIDQIALCDVLVANKTDLADDEALRLFDQLAVVSHPPKQLIAKTEFGKLDIKWLDFESDIKRRAVYENHHNVENHTDDGFQTLAWVFSKSKVFSLSKFRHSLEKLGLERAKAVIKTDEGWFIVNAQAERVSVTPISQSAGPIESRIELIHQQLDKQLLEQALNLYQEID
ncbi:MAG TPA: GTP-binding protein [Leucothrix mucor]|nr:GTP-binding protein [Leucothrix mucor]